MRKQYIEFPFLSCMIMPTYALFSDFAFFFFILCNGDYCLLCSWKFTHVLSALVWALLLSSFRLIYINMLSPAGQFCICTLSSVVITTRSEPHKVICGPWRRGGWVSDGDILAFIPCHGSFFLICIRKASLKAKGVDKRWKNSSDMHTHFKLLSRFHCHYFSYHHVKTGNIIWLKLQKERKVDYQEYK